MTNKQIRELRDRVGWEKGTPKVRVSQREYNFLQKMESYSKMPGFVIDTGDARRLASIEAKL